MIQPLWTIVWRFLIKLNMQLLCDPAVALLDNYPREIKAYVYTKACQEVFIAPLFAIAQNWHQPSCPAVREWLTSYGAFIPLDATQQ